MQAKPFRHNRLLSAMIAALALGASASSFAGEALEIEAPSMRTPLASSGGLTREEVRAELKEARDAGMLTRAGEAGDTRDVLVAREAFNVAQAERITAQYQAEYERQVAAVEAEQARLDAEAAAAAQAAAPVAADAPAAAEAPAIEGDAIDADLGAPGDSMMLEPLPEPQMQPQGGTIDNPGQGLRIDILDYNRTGVGRPEEMVVISMREGDEFTQREDMDRIRGHLTAMGLAEDQVYFESVRA